MMPLMTARMADNVVALPSRRLSKTMTPPSEGRVSSNFEICHHGANSSFQNDLYDSKITQGA